MPKRLYAYVKCYRIPVSAVYTLLTLFTALLTFAVFFLQFYSTNEIRHGLTAAPFLIFTLNWLPVLIITLFMLSVTGSLSVSCSLSAFVFIFAAIANRVKVSLRNDPLSPVDFSVGAEAFNTAAKIEGGGITKYVLLLVLVAGCGVIAAVFIKNKPLGRVKRIVCAVLCVASLFLMNGTLYSDKDLYESLPVISRYNLVSHYNTKGMIYAFWYQINDIGLFRKRAPESYDKHRVAEIIESGFSAVAAESEGKPPHIIAVMSEAFCDIASYGALSFDGYDDPYMNFYKLKSAGVSGEIVVPHMGGGTADTEFEFLTGFLKRREESLPYAFRIFSRSSDSLARTLAENGYTSIFVHPGASWFYNRAYVYELMGFDSSYFDESFPDAPTKGGYINEKDTVGTAISLFEEARATRAGEPVFLFLVTIQNHGPYEDKYGDWEVNFNVPDGFTGEEINIMANYIKGVKDQDDNLIYLADFLDSLDEPAVLLYFGDHIPSMPELLMKKAGLQFDYDNGFEGTMPLYKTPYLFWPNSAARQSGVFRNETVENGAVMGANFLGAALLDIIGLGDASALYSFLNELRRDISVMTKYDFITQRGHMRYEELQDSEKEKVDLYAHWQYYKLYEH